MLEPVTMEELEIMDNVYAIIVDREWFQIYDNNNKFTEDYVASGMYWNYFYNVWKTVSYSPFSNIVAFVDERKGGVIYDGNTITVEIASIEDYDGGKIITLLSNDDTAITASMNLKFIQTEALTRAGVAVHPYGAYILPATVLSGDSIAVEATINDSLDSLVGEIKFTGTIPLKPLATVGTQITLTKQI